MFCRIKTIENTTIGKNYSRWPKDSGVMQWGNTAMSQCSWDACDQCSPQNALGENTLRNSPSQKEGET